MRKSRSQADMSSKNGAQRRRFTRHRADLPLTVTVLRQDGYVQLQGRCHEIAEAGLGGVISTALVAGEVVSLEFSIPDVPQPLVLRAVVRHRAGFVHGFEFIGLSPEERDCILTFSRPLPLVP
jgi:PilZ domain-containing protein